MLITLVCPEGLMSDANNFAMVMTRGPDDGQTFASTNRQDGSGNEYSVVGFVAPASFLAASQATLSRPAWDTSNIIDMTAAGRAQAALVVDTDQTTLAVVTALTGYVGPAVDVAIAAAGLSDLDV